MKLVELKLTNYRAYKNETAISFEDLTVLVGRNDSGKSSVMDALNSFFNEYGPDREDASVSGDATAVRIACVFSELPATIVLDEQYSTSLGDEYLLRKDGRLEICKTFNLSGGKSKFVVTAKAFHPTTPDYQDLLKLKNKELKDRFKKLGVNAPEVNQSINAELRKAIWSHAPDLAQEEQDVDLASETGKAVWEQLQAHLPVFALFKSDRASTDQDDEAQDPMKAAIKETIKAHEVALNGVVDKVRAELETFVKRTVEKIQEMDPYLAKELNPQIKNKNWDSLFSVSLTGDEGISINKRGSGTRRLVLLNFFRAKAEDVSNNKGTGVIYGIEEPETSQHPNHQIMLLDSFQSLVEAGQCQIVLTTHTPTLARKIDRNCLRMISRDGGKPIVLHGREDSTLVAIKSTLGVLPDHDIKVFLGVEGKWDIQFLHRISRILAQTDPAIPNLQEAEENGSLVFVPLGGSSMDLWTFRLANLDRPEFYLTDRDTPPPAKPKYHDHLENWNARSNCTAWHTSKRELENYIHPTCIQRIAPAFPSSISDFDDVPMRLAECLHAASGSPNPWSGLSKEDKGKKASHAKKRLNTECVEFMTPALLAVTDPANEISSWLMAIKHVLGK